jgi:hypothetical protein
MLKTVPFQDRMEARHSDLNAIQSSSRRRLLAMASAMPIPKPKSSTS